MNWVHTLVNYDQDPALQKSIEVATGLSWSEIVAIAIVVGAKEGAKKASKVISKWFRVSTKTGTKIKRQLEKRGWDKDSIDEIISKPSRTVKTKDRRYNSDVTRRDDPATAYFDKDGNYVVRNNKTGDIVQISDKTDPEWKIPIDLQ